ncbi:hypothetical protein M9H77_31791 [Catharanthus roseus]|uniref:Uncharacterized protein n=1 Tax=Catharanthus roseus TaxID=4058 RepID=A0ACC0A1Y9_CATRO|nr:hypothetical protein M9H77_31791 [Catharanthus roseus]
MGVSENNTIHINIEVESSQKKAPISSKKPSKCESGKLVQNTDDNIYPENVELILIFVLQEKGNVVMNNEMGFSADNIRALCDVGHSTKRGYAAGYIGMKGVTDAPEIHSNGFHIKFDAIEGQIVFVLPTEIPPCDIDLYRRLVMLDTDQMNGNSWNTCILHPSLLLFLHRLQCIKFRDMLNDRLVVMKKVLTDGIIQVSLGKKKMYWFVVSQKLQAGSIRPDVHSTEISIAFTLEETGDGAYAPQLNNSLFLLLPLRTFGLKLILQVILFCLHLPWNQWLLSEFPGLFVGSEQAFCDIPCFQRNPGKAVIHAFFFPAKLFNKHLGLGFLNKDIVLPDSLAKALGIEDMDQKPYFVLCPCCLTQSALPKLYAILQTVNPDLFSAAADSEGLSSDKTIVENVTRLLLKVGVQRLPVHDTVKVHILPAITDTRNIFANEDLMVEYLCFTMFHLQSGCRDCFVESEWVMEQVRSKALILTNYGFKQLNEIRIHFNKEYVNQIAVNKLLDGIDLRWHEIDTKYLRHPITKSFCDGMSNWFICYHICLLEVTMKSSSTSWKYLIPVGIVVSVTKLLAIAISPLEKENLSGVHLSASSRMFDGWYQLLIITHYPKDLFHDCESVSSILECILFSITQMLKLYNFIWNEMTSSKQKICEGLSSGPFIFIPFVAAPSPDDVVTGSLLSPKEVYSCDTTGSVDLMKLMHSEPISDITLEENLPSNRYLQILLEFSTMALASQAARTVFHVFSNWADGLISGSLNNNDVEYLRESFLKREYAVLPTEQDTWISLHPSLGVISSQQYRSPLFRVLQFNEKEMLQTKIAALLRRLGIPALSGVVSREAIYYGPTDSSFKTSLVNWALPYAQRYICHLHPDRYLQLGNPVVEKSRHLQIVIVEKLFYRNVVKKCEIASKKRVECSCLLQVNILYATRDSDSH